MNILTIALIGTYTLIIASLIWARFQFFVIKSKRSRISSLVYDPAVVVQILFTYYYFLATTNPGLTSSYFALCLYVMSLTLFWWAIVTAKKLNFAFSAEVGEIVTTGPFAWVRHPIYLSYVFIWLGSTLLFNSLPLWITLVYLITFYVFSAKSEEKVILNSRYSTEYLEYSQNVGMFLPRINYGKAEI
ncbi:MAG: hypothetical protein CMQ17_04600 [Gammaproteobacteria bacterium]|nr:hypothetical protein [Gammaproteobacteria bacterium]|tara:strand:- start:6737 stop:7300 length:564 start_codon:yes stop_codon:yes gene_type:complete